jgi:hypothetical protein
MDNYKQPLLKQSYAPLTVEEAPRKEEQKALRKVMKRKSSGCKQVSPYRTEEFKAFEARELAVINAPSIYPEDAELPAHATGENNTRYIQKAITELRRNEPSIAKLNRKQLFHELIWPFTQRIQTYAMEPSAHNKICGQIDPRIVRWAEAVAGKVRAREAILKKREQIAETRKATVGPKKPRRNRKVGYERRISEYRRPLNALLRKIDFLPEESGQLALDTQEILTRYFEERKARYAKQIPHSKTGATPVTTTNTRSNTEETDEQKRICAAGAFVAD